MDLFGNFQSIETTLQIRRAHLNWRIAIIVEINSTFDCSTVLKIETEIHVPLSSSTHDLLSVVSRNTGRENRKSIYRARKGGDENRNSEKCFLKTGRSWSAVQFEVAGSLSSTCRPTSSRPLWKNVAGKRGEVFWEENETRQRKLSQFAKWPVETSRGFSRLIEGRNFRLSADRATFSLSKKSKVKKRKGGEKGKRPSVRLTSFVVRSLLVHYDFPLLRNKGRRIVTLSREIVLLRARGAANIPASVEFSANGLTRDPLFSLPRVPLIVPRLHCFLSFFFFFTALEERSAYYKGPQNVQEPKREESGGKSIFRP